MASRPHPRSLMTVSPTTQKFSLILVPLFLLLFTAPATSIPTKTPSDFLPQYNKQCGNIVPSSPITESHVDFSQNKYNILHFDIAYFTGGHQFLPAGQKSSVSISFSPKRASFFMTQSPDVVQFQATLKFVVPFRFNSTSRRNLRQIHFRAPRIPVRPKSVVFKFFGFWSMRSGNVCMVGSRSTLAGFRGVSDLNVALKLNYPVDFSKVSSLINGVLESFGDKASVDYFEPISILGIPNYGGYEYTLIKNGSESVCRSEDDDGNGEKGENLRLEMFDPTTCLSQLYRYARNFELDYGSECGSGNGGRCNPLDGDVGNLPKYMTIQGVSCEYGHAVRFLIGFSDAVSYGNELFGYNRVLDPNNMLIGEGSWDERKNKLCLVACRFLNFRDSLANTSVGDCFVKLSLRFPKSLTVRSRSMVLGQITSYKSQDSATYFNKITFHGSDNRISRLPGLKYEYTVLDRIDAICPEQKLVKGREKSYPSVYSTDMRFDMSVRNSKGQIAEGYLTPLFVGDQLYEPYRMNNSDMGIKSLSYMISMTAITDFEMGNELLSNESVGISAEGNYNNETGVLCMIGCRHLKSIRNESIDCEIFINVQFPSQNEKSGVHIEGTISSLRNKSDNLYFRELQMSSNSISVREAVESIWRMDMEITMVLISNTLICVFTGLQLYHVKIHPNMLPYISLMMLMILTMGNMIPLVLNFDALFMANRNRQNLFLGGGGSVEVNEVIVRVVSMIAFLLQFRLLQLTWAAKQSDGSNKRLWHSEKKVLYLSLPLYVCGGLVAWYVHQWKSSYKNVLLWPHSMRLQPSYSWGDFKTYAGLIRDGFLLPQIMFNLFLNSLENTLSISFYLGLTIVCVLPHTYDLYRSHSSTWHPDFSYIYGNHRQDFYSTGWDIVIFLSALLFSLLIYLQQRYGGRCILPKKFRGNADYEKVPAASNEEL